MSPSTQLALIHSIAGLKSKMFQALVKAKAFEIPLSSWTHEKLSAWAVEPDQRTLLLSEIPKLNGDQFAETLEQREITVIAIIDSRYPAQLREIPSPPSVLYVRGNINNLSAPSLAVVGTRLPTPYGLTVTKRLVEPIAQHHIPIVSGLALGIDTAAHQAALSAGGPTVAVLGCGVDHIYPWQNQRLAEDILAHGGTIVSEFPLGARPERHHFPQRNRIISGLSKAVLLVEAGEKSGALITAKFAVDQNRDVLVVPGPITSPQSIGPLNWLKLGATPVTTVEDIFRTFSMVAITPDAPPQRIHSDDPIEAMVIEHLHQQSRHIDALAESCRLDTSVVSAVLSLLEIRGLVIHDGGMIYRLNM